MSNRQIYNIEHNIPRVNLSMPGRQNRSGDGSLRITPGLNETIEFIFGNQDGLPISLTPFAILFVCWVQQNMDNDVIELCQSKILLSKEIQVIQPYSGTIVAILSSDDTLSLTREGTSSVNWALLMINSDGQTFPTEVDRNGKRSGTINFDYAAGLPIAEILKPLSA